MNSAEVLAFASQNPMLSLAFVGLSLALVYTEVARLFRGFREIGPPQLTDLINRGEALVVDLRADGEYEKGHIVGSRHLLLSQLAPEHKLLAKADREKPVALVCAQGQSAQGAAATLVKAGFKQVVVLEGGIAAWQQAGLPLAKGRG